MSVVVLLVPWSQVHVLRSFAEVDIVFSIEAGLLFFLSIVLSCFSLAAVVVLV